MGARLVRASAATTPPAAPARHAVSAQPRAEGLRDLELQPTKGREHARSEGRGEEEDEDGDEDTNDEDEGGNQSGNPPREAEPEPASDIEAPADGEERLCRICFEDDEDVELGPLIQPCKCAGTQRWVHRDCLERWRTSSEEASARCTTCHFRFKVEDVSLSESTRERKRLLWKNLALLLADVIVTLTVVFLWATAGGSLVLQIVSIVAGIVAMHPRVCPSIMENIRMHSILLFIVFGVSLAIALHFEDPVAAVLRASALALSLNVLWTTVSIEETMKENRDRISRLELTRTRVLCLHERPELLDDALTQ